MNKNNIEKLQENEVLKEILKDSFGGVIYDVSNQDKYNTTELLKLWENLDNSEKESAGGIIKGAIDFIREA